MRKSISAAIAVAAVLCTSTASLAHVPPNFIGLVWQWPANQIPVLDGNTQEWDIIPDDYAFIPEGAVARFEPSTGNFVASTDFNLASLDFRIVPAYVNGGSRLYFQYERFDDVWTADDTFEPVIDGDHSGGNFWSEEGQSDEEAARSKGRQAQIYHVLVDDGFRLGGDRWNWFWMTTADWHEQPPWSQMAYDYGNGVPGSFTEVTVTSEFYQTVWDDFNWQDPEGSIQHVFAEGEIIGHQPHIWDFDGNEENYRTEGCECGAGWGTNAANESFGDASFLSDYLLDSVQDDLLPTAVEEDSWGSIKASLAQ